MSNAPEIEALASPPLATPWVPIWPLSPSALGELAYAEFTAQVGVTGTTEANANAVVTAPAITCDGTTPVLVEFYARNIVTPTVVGASITLYLYMDGASLGALSAVQNPSANNLVVPVTAARRLTPAAGSHTFSIRAAGSQGGFLINAGPGGSGQQMPGFIRVSLAAPIMPHSPGAAMPVAYGTSLPTAPLDGQEAILVDSLTAPTYQWRFRYNAGSSSAYKWEFVGGGPIVVGVGIGVAETTSSVSYAALATAGPSVALPRAGDYDVIAAMDHFNSTANTTDLMSYDIGGTAAVDGNAALAISITNINYTHTESRRRHTGLAPVTLTAKYRTTGGTATIIYRYLTVCPVRVS